MTEQRLSAANRLLKPCLLTAFLLAGALPTHAADATPGARLSLNADWRFTKDDPAGTEDKLSYATLKPYLLASATNAATAARPDGNPGEDVPYAQAQFDDAGWRKLNLPHDWGIEGPFDQKYPGETGKLPWWGVGWYRHRFSVPAGDRGKQIYLDVDGAMAYAAVWVNGHLVGGWPYGYASWRLDLTPWLKYGEENVLAIRLQNPRDSSRWYPGGGIYRNIWLVKTSPIHVSHWGAQVATPKVSPVSATITLAIQAENHSSGQAQVTAATEVFRADAAGKPHGSSVGRSAPAQLKIPAGDASNATLTLSVAKPKLWSIETPELYVAVTTLTQNGQTLDVCETPFGIRAFEFTVDKGFFLNGQHVRLQGVCDHHDLGALGSAINIRALERQLQILKEMGCNAIRTSHNPPAPELLDLCDRLGFVVMDEAFDCWARAKKRNDYHLLYPDWHELDLRAFVRRDRNHPCVVLWSIGNEIPEQGMRDGPAMAAELARIVKSEDTTRPVSSGCNHTEAGYNGFQKALDVFGYNYKSPSDYARFRAANPTQPIFGSETASTVSSRGEYFFPVSNDKSKGKADFQMSSYDLSAPPWAWPPEYEFRGEDENPFVAGEFVWTGFDYLGEPTPYNADTSNLLNFTDPADQERMAKELKELGKINVPSRSSYFGIVDLAGFKKDRFYIYQARWRPELPMAHLLPHWTWPDRVGQVTPVHVYTSGDEAELFLNGKSLGRKKRDALQYRLRWDDVVYQPGELKVVAYRKGKRWAEDSMRTAGPATQLLVEPDRKTIGADGQDLCFVTVKVADRNKLLVPRAKDQIQFEVSGPGELVGTDNGDATSFESFQAPSHKAYNGLCLAIVRSTGKPGTIVVRAAGAGLKGVEVKVKAGK
jgi:beta-galactosidase